MSNRDNCNDYNVLGWVFNQQKIREADPECKCYQALRILLKHWQRNMLNFCDILKINNIKTNIKKNVSCYLLTKEMDERKKK